MPATAPTALLVGTSRGLGLGLVRGYLARGWRVIATARDNDRALKALAGNDRLVVTGHASTPGYNDPAYPIEGRRPRTAG